MENAQSSILVGGAMNNIIISIIITACIVDIGYFLFKFISVERITREAIKCLKNGNFEVVERKDDGSNK